MANEVRLVPKSSGIVTDLGAIDGTPTGYATSIIYDDLTRTSGNVFVWLSTGPPGYQNGGTIYAGLTGYWQMQFDGAVNVQWFGAGDGVTGDLLAINAALQVGAGGDVYIPQIPGSHYTIIPYIPTGGSSIGSILIPSNTSLVRP
jgi:hypothetical protein